MTGKKHARKRSAHAESPDTTSAEGSTLSAEELTALDAQANSPAAKRAFERDQRTVSDRPVPTYTKDHEVAAARAMYGADYETLIAKGSIVAPTYEEEPHAALVARLAKKDAKAEKADE